MTKKVIWILMVVFAILIGLYPGIYFLIDRKFGLLSSKSNDLLSSTFWNIGFYTHIILGGIALLIGWTQFISKFRMMNLTMHRLIGRIYLISVLFSSLSSLYIGFYATGGLISTLGFISLGLFWFYNSLKAYLFAKNQQIVEHKKAMVYSYAACFAAVTLRIWLPILLVVFGDFITAYRMVAWLCWIPNLIVANLISKRITAQNI